MFQPRNPCAGCEARREEIAHLREENKDLLNRLMAMIGHQEALQAALNSAIEKDENQEEQKTGMEAEVAALNEEEALSERLDLEAERELIKIAESKGVDVNALRDL